jgi:hypothetical protein
MELISSMPSQKVKMTVNDETGKLITINRVNDFIKPINQSVYELLLKSIKWDEEISIEEADSLLEKSFYPFKQVLYLFKKIFVFNI